MNCKKSLSNITFFDDGLGTHIEEGEVDCEALFVNGVQITQNGGGGAGIPSISYVAGSPDVTTISGNTVINNLNGFTSANLINALNQTVSLTSPAQTQLTGLTTKTANMTGTGSTTLFAGTLTLNANTTLVTNRTMTVNGAISFGVNGNIISNGVTLTNTQIGFLGGATANLQNQISTLQNKTTNQFYNSSLDRTQITGITLLENLNMSNTINSRLINVGTSVNPSSINLNGDLIIPAASTITANGVVISSTELSFLDGASSNIQTQITNANTTIGNHTTSINDINDEIGPIVGVAGTINQRIFDTEATASAGLAAAIIADGLAVSAGIAAAAAGTAAAAAAADATTANGRCTTLETKTTEQTFLAAGSGQPDRTVFDSDVIANRLRSNELLPDTGNSVAFNITGTSTFSGSVTVQGNLSTTGTSTFTGTSTCNGASVLNGVVGINAATSFNGKSTTFYAEIPAYPLSPKAIVYSYQPLILYDGLEITGDIRMYDGYKITVNKIVPNAIIGVDTLQLCSGLAVGTELVKVSSNMTLDATYTFLNNGITTLHGNTRIGRNANLDNLVIVADDINSYAITSLYDANNLVFGTQANCTSAEIATNTNINLRSATVNVIADMAIEPTNILYTNKIVAGITAGVDTLQLNSGAVANTELLKISSNTDIDPLYTFNAKGNVNIGDSTQTGAVESFTSFSELQLKSAISLYENILSGFKDATIFATKTVGATVNFIGTLNVFCRNIIYTNINNIYYRTSTASGFFDTTTSISTVNAAVQNGGRVLNQAYQYDIEALTFNIGNANTTTFNLTGQDLNLGEAVNTDNINLISGLTTEIQSTIVDIIAPSTSFGSVANPTIYSSFFNCNLHSNYALVINEFKVDAVTNPFKNCIIYANRLVGATVQGVGSLFIMARVFTFSNIQTIGYKSADANGYNDVTTTISAGTAGSNSGQMKIQASVIDLESPSVLIGLNAASITTCRGAIYQF